MDCDGFIYMDCNATTKIAPSVVGTISEALESGWANPSSSYQAGKEAKKMIIKARQQLMTLVNGKTTSEVTFTSGGTESNHHVIWMALKYFHSFHGNNKHVIPHVITSSIEHDSILKPLQQLQTEGMQVFVNWKDLETFRSINQGEFLSH